MQFCLEVKKVHNSEVYTRDLALRTLSEASLARGLHLEHVQLNAEPLGSPVLARLEQDATRGLPCYHPDAVASPGP